MERQMEKRHGKAEAEAGPEAPGLAGNHQKWENGFSLRAPRGASLISDFWTHEVRENKFCYFKPPTQSAAISYSSWRKLELEA